MLGNGQRRPLRGGSIYPRPRISKGQPHKVWGEEKIILGNGEQHGPRPVIVRTDCCGYMSGKWQQGKLRREAGPDAEPASLSGKGSRSALSMRF